MTSRVVVVGASGQLGRQLVSTFTLAGHDVVGLGHGDLELADLNASALLVSMRPEIVINAAAWTDVDACARDPERAMLLNGVAPGRLAAGAAEAEALFVQISTNEVFEGSSEGGYAEQDPPHPINPYGASKFAGERAVASAGSDHLIVRTAWLFGPGGTNFVTKIVAAADRAARLGEPLRVVADEWGNPTWTPSLSVAIEELTTGFRTSRIIHLAGEPATTRLEWARTILAVARPESQLEAVTLDSYERSSTVPARAVLRATSDVPRISWTVPTQEYARSLGSSGPSGVPSV